MTKRLVEIDDDDLRDAQQARGYATIKETVAAGLREITATEARKREVARLSSGFLGEGEARNDAWR